MDASERDKITTLPSPYFEPDNRANHNHEFVFQPPEGALGQNVANPRTERYLSIDGLENNDHVGKNEHHMKSGQLGMCIDQYCTMCATHSRTSNILNAKLHNRLYRGAKGCAKRLLSNMLMYIPGVMNPHARLLQQWSKFFVFSCSVAAFLDPLFFFLLSVHQNNKCIVLSWPMTTTIVVLRSMTDFIYWMHILIQFRLAYVDPKSISAGDLVDDPRKIARNYILGYFGIDLFVVLPLPQIIILILRNSMGAYSANYAKILLQAAILAQYIPRLYRFLPLIAGSTPIGFIFESVWSSSVIHLLTIFFTCHMVGSCWYLFGLQRVNECFKDACDKSNITRCMDFINCRHVNDYREFQNDPAWDLWNTNENATACFGKDGFDFGIYKDSINLTTHKSVVMRYVYSFFWGFQQISTLTGNLVPSYSTLEVLFTMVIIGAGLVLFALLIGNMQIFQEAVGRRQKEMYLRRRDIEQWMKHRHLPEELQRRVRWSERYNWAMTKGIDENMVMENLSNDLQREIRRHLFTFVKKVTIFQQLDERIIDAICERLRRKAYIPGTKILFRGGLVDTMVFIIRGEMESIGQDLNVVPLSEGDVCGEELLTWYLENSSVNKDGKSIRIPLSNRLVRCLTRVEAFVLQAPDLEELTRLFARFSTRQPVQGATSNESPNPRGVAARRFRVAWRYRKKRINRANVSSSPK